MLAEKVETQEDFNQALHSGYEYFQGYFFAWPSIVAGRATPASKPRLLDDAITTAATGHPDAPRLMRRVRVNILNLISEVHRPELDHAPVENIIKHEVSLTLKLLTHLRTAAWGFRRPIESVQHAILLLGDQGLRRWASVVAIAALGSDQPNELVIASVVRASFCEGLLHDDLVLGDLAQDGFFLGLFSTIDAFLGRPLPEAVDRLPVSEEVRTALLGGDNALRRVYDVVLAWERGAWDEVSLAAARLGLRGEEIAARYKSALEFGNSVALVEGGRPARV
jgi:EAL and modified HD-GYP domain-containing signal transduction protein